MTTQSPVTCTTCGADIPPDAPEGRCPACMLQAGFAIDVGAVGFEGVPTPAFLEGLFPQFAVEAELARGGMGVVYRARQRSLDRPVALKLLPPEVAATPGFAERFRREARTLAQLAHPNIVAVHEAAEADGHYVLAMELVDGVNLRQALMDGGLTPDQALAVVPQICDALQYAHDQGVVHRDIKPDNILLTRDGRVKIADFGLAKLLRRAPGDATLTGTEQVMGTFHYLAPEQIRSPKDVDHRADIYALGVVFYELLTGELPIGRFPAPSERVQVDVRLDEVVLRALEREREQRYQQADEIKTGIQHATQVQTKPAHLGGPESPARGSGAPPRSTRLNPWAIAGVLCLPAALLAGVLTFALGARDEIAFVAALAVVATGMILAVVGKHEILGAPERWHGLGLAKAAFRIPLFLGLAAGIAMILLVPRRASRRESARRAALEMGARVVDERELENAVQRVLLGVEQLRFGMVPLSEVVELIDPRERQLFLDMPSDAFSARHEAGELGFAMFPVDTLSAPVTSFEVLSIDRVAADGALISIGHLGERVRFPMVRVEGDWYLALGRVEHSGRSAPIAGEAADGR